VAQEPQAEKRFFARRLRLSIEKVEAALRAAYEIRRLGEEEKDGLLPEVTYSAAWEVMHRRIEEAPSLIVAVDQQFPATIPNVFVPNAEKWFLKIPHVDKRGTLCIYPAHTVIDQFNCGAAVLEMVVRGVELMEEGFSGKNQDEFVRETEGYWAQVAEPPELISAGELKGASRWLKAAWLESKKRLVVAEKQEALVPWFTALAARQPARSFDVAFVWLDVPLRPDDFPATNADVFRLIDEAGLEDAGRAAIRARRSALFVIIAFHVGSGIAAVAASIRGFEQPINGYRPQSITGEMLAARWGTLRCGRHIINRANPDWLHWRGGADEDRISIASANVMIVGCGAVGADVAMYLAKAGVRKFTLVDHDLLKWENIGRHMLGARWVGRFKARALAYALSSHFPHLKTEVSFDRIEAICSDHGETLARFDLIICMTADWMGESALNLWARQFSAKAVIYGWLEPHGLAGHGLLVTGKGGCLACGRGDGGTVREPVIEWANEPIMKVPACGGWFTPHGAIDSGPAKEMIAQLALDTLSGSTCNSTQRIFIGDHRRIESHGGIVREPWRSYGGDPAILNRTITRPWPANPQCPLCDRPPKN
jgi:hypothetical protein